MALDEQYWYVTLPLVVSALISITANLLLLVLFSRRRGLRSISNRFVINLLITNLLSSVFLVPLLLVDHAKDSLDGKPLIDGDRIGGSGRTTELEERTINVTTNANASSSRTILAENIVIAMKTKIRERDRLLFEEDDRLIVDERRPGDDGDVAEELEFYHYFANVTQFDGNDVLCYLAQCSTSLVCTTSIFSILLIGIDQYFAVLHSLRYHFYMNKFRSLLLISTTWIASVLFAVGGVLAQKDANFWHFCAPPSDERAIRTIYSIVYVALVIALPFAAICAIYVCIYVAARRNSERTRQSTSSSSAIDSLRSMSDRQQQQQLPKVRSAPNFVTFQTENETRFAAHAHHRSDAIGKPTGDESARKGPSVRYLSDPTTNDCRCKGAGIVAVRAHKSPGSCRRKKAAAAAADVTASGKRDLARVCSVPMSKREIVRTLEARRDCLCDEGRRSAARLDARPEEGDAENVARRVQVARTCSERANANFISNIRGKITGASIFRYREEGRAAKISILVIFVVSICYVPYGVSLTLDGYTSRTFHHASMILLITSNVVSPFLFAYRNRRIQRELYKFFGVKSNRLALMNSSKNYCRASLLQKRMEKREREEEAEEEERRRRAVAAATTTAAASANGGEDEIDEPLMNGDGGCCANVPRVIVTCKVEGEKKSILKRVCSGNWQNYKKCNFIAVPESCVHGEARGSFSSASTQISSDE